VIAGRFIVFVVAESGFVVFSLSQFIEGGRVIEHPL
jgi:hypothetical protein